MRNIKIVLEYDGTDFCGWQYQPQLRTVQDELQRSLKKIFQKEITVIGAGRTDSGVHARGQVANFLIDKEMEPATIMAALNGNLPRDIRILSAEEVELAFNARYKAVRRHYRYFITRIERALNRHYMWCFKSDLAVDKMQRASDFLLGYHDFKSFCQEGADVKHHFCNVEKIAWQQKDEMLICEIIANRFLHGMVRIIIGTMIEVGRGYTDIEKIPLILAARDRRQAGQTAPAKGLCLEKIDY